MLPRLPREPLSPRYRYLELRSRAASLCLAQPPGMVATFSLWRNVEAMREYARGRRDGAHPAATAIHRGNPFHHESAFVRFRPYAWQGHWDGADPLAEAGQVTAAAGADAGS